MPLAVLCESANTMRWACADAARSLLSTSGKNVLGLGVDVSAPATSAQATSASEPATTSPPAAPSAPPRNVRLDNAPDEHAPGGRGAEGIPLSCLPVTGTG